MKGRQSEVSGTLRIGAYLEFAKSKLTVLLKEFIQNFQTPTLNGFRFALTPA